jgi:hypothetical protein
LREPAAGAEILATEVSVLEKSGRRLVPTENYTLYRLIERLPGVIRNISEFAMLPEDKQLLLMQYEHIREAEEAEEVKMIGQMLGLGKVVPRG